METVSAEHVVLVLWIHASGSYVVVQFIVCGYDMDANVKLMMDRYAYSGDVDEENEEAQSLTGGKQDGDISLVKQEKNTDSDREEDVEEDKRE